MGNQAAESGEPVESKTIAFFDVDNTLVKGACLYYFGIEAYRRKYISFKDVVRFARKNLSFMVVGENRAHLVQVRERALTLLKGRSVSGVKELAEIATKKRVLKHLIPESVQRLREHQLRGDQVWLATAAPMPLAAELKSELGATGAIGTQLLFADGHYTGELDGPVVHAEEKAKQAAQTVEALGVDLADCWAYSDSYNDLPLLTMVGNPVAVNPDRNLEEYALKHGWEIIRIRKRASKPLEPSQITAS